MACTLPCKYLYMNENIELIVCWLSHSQHSHIYGFFFIYFFYKQCSFVVVVVVVVAVAVIIVL